MDVHSPQPHVSTAAAEQDNTSICTECQLSDAGKYAYASLCAVFFHKLYEDDYHRDYKYQMLSELLDHLKQPKQVCSSMYHILNDSSLGTDVEPLISLLKEECGNDGGLLIIKDLILVGIAKGCYDARLRVLVKHICLEFRISVDVLQELETSLTEALESQEYQTSEDEKKEIHRKQRNTKLKRYALIGLATVGGGTLIGLTGGLAAPLVAAGAGAIIGGAGAAALGSVAGVAIIGSLFGVAGAGLTGYKMKKRVGAVEEFEFEPLVIGGPLQSATRRKQLHIAICVTGWLTSKMQDFKYPWAALAESEEQYSLRWESKYLLQLGKAIDYILSFAVSYATQEALKYTILSGLLAAIAWPATLVTAAGVIDNPWSVCTHRAATVGKQLAEVLLSRQQGNRPVTLIGYSMGARVIFHCLEELCKRKGCEGIIEDAILLGAPVSGHPKYWQRFSRVVSGRIVNGYARGDWLLKFLYRTASIQISIAGLRPVSWDNRRMHNVDLSDVVTGHMDYMNKIDLILEVVGVRKTPTADSSSSSSNNSLLMPPRITKSLSTSDKLSALSLTDQCLHDSNLVPSPSNLESAATTTLADDNDCLINQHSPSSLESEGTATLDDDDDDCHLIQHIENLSTSDVSADNVENDPANSLCNLRSEATATLADDNDFHINQHSPSSLESEGTTTFDDDDDVCHLVQHVENLNTSGNSADNVENDRANSLSAQSVISTSDCSEFDIQERDIPCHQSSELEEGVVSSNSPDSNSRPCQDTSARS